MTEHTWFECPLCGLAVRCGKCGNNCCNGGFGELPDGSQCDACPSAYDKQYNEVPARIEAFGQDRNGLDGEATKAGKAAKPLS